MGFELRCKDTMKKLGFANFFAKKIQENAFSLYCAEYQVFIIFKKMTEVNSQNHRFTYAVWVQKYAII